ncbi:M4 family metallopeptidase [Streptosporangium sp. CA-135522]|uniref:M4 family metallopeptidase n=1 Tax=Streptosporangium sp. CA-135522 TaxID=3240072 RepID=UPI003D8AD7FA
MKRSVAFALVTTATSMLVALSSASAGATGLTVLSPSITPPDSPAQAADRLVQAEPSFLQASAQDRFLRRDAIPGKGGLNYVSYTRTYSGLPVYGGDFVVVTNSSGGVLSTSIAQTQTLNVDTTPKVEAQKAAEIAKAEVAEATEVAAPKLSVMAQGSGRLAYEVVVNGTSKGRESKLHVFVDALTGEVVEKSDEVMDGQGSSYYNGPVTIGTTSGTPYSMTDPARSGIRCGGQGGTAYTGPDDNWGNGTGTDLETACVDTLHAVGKEWDMLSAWLGRNGINGTGGGFPARVGLSDVNAYWNGSYTNFGHSQDNQRQATPMDVVAHEFGHAIFQTTPGGSTGSNEKGGLNESTGDIFGALTEFYANEPAQYDPPDLSVGEEVNLVGSGPIRYMHKPSQISGHPDCYSASVPNMEVHAGAGVQNHWFYLLSQGTNPTNGQPVSPTCNSSTITGLGIQKAGQIFMGALQRKTATWTHQLVRKASLEAALQLFPGSCNEFNVTKAAWTAVNVPAATGEPTSCSTGNDFSMTLNPTSASVQAGQQATTTVGTQTTSGSAQNVTFSAAGLPSGVTASFNPASVTSGASSTLTLTTSASTASGSYTITVTGTGGSATHTATFALTVGGGTGPCGGRQHTYTGTLSSGSSVYQPSTSGFQTTTSGTHTACLDGPNGTDFDLYLQKQNASGTWSNVASGTSVNPDEAFTYNGTAGYYRYRVHAYSGSGTYTLGYDAP